MPIHIDRYTVKLHFDRFFADPRLFQVNSNLARLMLQENGLDSSKADLIIVLESFRATSENGEAAKIAGTANYGFQGKKTRTEYMENVTVFEEYFDLGTGLSSNDHHRYWSRGRIWTMSYGLVRFDHEPVILKVPDMMELYAMIKSQAHPTTIASVELENIPRNLFDIALGYLEMMLGKMAEQDRMALEIYASRYLDPSERNALDKRLTRESTDRTVYVILGKN